MAIDQLYASRIRNEVGLFATWLPNARIEIGQYGPLRRALFQPQGQLKGFHANTSAAKANYDFTICAERVINPNAQALAEAGVSSGNVLLEVHFSSEAAVTFSAPDAVITRVDDIRALGEQLVEMQKAGTWRWDDGIVIEVVTAPRATIIASQERNAVVKFEVSAQAATRGGVMASLDESSSVRIMKGVGAKIIGQGPLTPLFRLAFLKSYLFSDPTISLRGPAETDNAPERVEISATEYLEIY